MVSKCIHFNPPYYKWSERERADLCCVGFSKMSFIRRTLRVEFPRSRYWKPMRKGRDVRKHFVPEFCPHSPCLRTPWTGGRGASRRTRRWTRSERRERRGRDKNIDSSSFRHNYPPTGNDGRTWTIFWWISRINFIVGRTSLHSCHRLNSGRLEEVGISCKWSKTLTWPTVPWPETEKLH